MTRKLYDASGMFELRVNQRVIARRGKFKGRKGVLLFIRRIHEQDRCYVRFGDGESTWLGNRSIDICI